MRARLTGALSRVPASTLMGLAFTLPALLTAVFLIGYHYTRSRNYISEEGARYAEILADSIVSASQRFLREGSITAIQQLMEDTGSNRSVQDVALVDAAGKVIASNRREWIGQDDAVLDQATYHEAAAAARASFQPEHRLTEGGSRMVLVVPLLFQGSSPNLAAGRKGMLYLKIDHESRLREVSTGILRRGAASAMLIVAASLVMLLGMRAILIRPILQAASYVRGVAEGREEPPPQIAGPREVAQLVQDVQHMVHELQSKERALLHSEAQLREAQRMESVASLAGSLAHDFNNLLTGILGYARLLLDRVGPGDPIRRQLAAIETSATRAASLTGQLLTFSRRSAARPEPQDLGRALQPALEAFGRDLPGPVELILEVSPGLWPAPVDAEQIRRAVSALCANAREAVPHGGRITVAIENREIGPGDCRGRLEARQGRFVAVGVSDTGRGLDPEVRRRLFEPFVTTKKGRRTAGFGLATAYGLVKGHEGWIEVETGQGRGTTFTIYLPAAETRKPDVGTDIRAAAPRAGDARPAARRDRAAREEAGREVAVAVPAVQFAAPGVDGPDTQAAATVAPGSVPPVEATQPMPAPAPADPGPARTVLAVDDEPTILALARDVLEMNGYRVLTARNGQEALQVYLEHRDRIDMVLLDLTMPVMGGMECFRRLRAIDPGVRVVVSSGFSSDGTAAEVLRDGARGYLQKPYEIQELARAVAAALDGPDPIPSPAPRAAAG